MTTERTPTMTATSAPTCHPEKPLYARGLCKRCYNASNTAALRARRATPDDTPPPTTPLAARSLDEPEWQEPFLVAYRVCGSQRMAARTAGVSYATITLHAKESPEFAVHLVDAREYYLDSLESNLGVLAKTKNNAIANIARLRADRPSRYLDKAQLQSVININTNISPPPPGELRGLLLEMLGDAAPESLKSLLALPPAESVIDAEAVKP